jgi:hypothetical protein
VELPGVAGVQSPLVCDAATRECNSVTCPEIEGATYTNAARTFGTVTISGEVVTEAYTSPGLEECAEGYAWTSADGAATCQIDGAWSGGAAACPPAWDSGGERHACASCEDRSNGWISEIRCWVEFNPIFAVDSADSSKS